MTNKPKKISDLPALSPASLDTTYIVGISGSTTYKISINQLTSSLDTTFATDLVTTALSSSLNSKLSTSSFNSYTASFSASVPNGTISGSSQLTSSFDGRYAITGSANAILYQTASAASTWTFNHFLATPYPVVTVYDNNNNIIIPQSITSNDSSSLTITFSSARTGVAVASKGGYVGSAVGTATTANALSTARLINGTSFDGTQNITIPNLVSGSSQVSLAGTLDYTSLFTGIASATSSLNTKFSTLGGLTGSFATTGSNIFRGNQTITGSLFVSGTILQNDGGLALQDGTILYHSSSTWFIPTSTVSTSGTTATSVGTQFTSGMVGAKLTILRESKIITAFTSNTQVTVDSAYSQNYSSIPSGSWGVYSKAFEIKADSTIGYYDKTGTFVFGKRSDSNVLAQNLLSSTSDSFYLLANSFGINKNFTINWSDDTSGVNTKSIGLRRNNTGSLEIFDGINVDGAVANRRDLILRNITGSNAFFSGSTTITGSLGVSGSQAITGSFYLNGRKQFNVGAFASTITQSGSANVSQSISFNTTDISQGVSIVSNSKITLANTGTYNIQFSAQVDRVSGSGTDVVYIWLTKNGVNVSNSATVVTVSGAAAAAKVVPAWNFVVDANANDYYELIWQSPDANIQIIKFAASGNIPLIPSVILTVTQVA
jgi:hypothetical protein